MPYENDESIELFQTNKQQEITTSWIEVESLNGKEFTETSGKIDIYIPPNIKYLDPAQSYLSFDLEVENSDGTPIKLNRQGASALFRSIRIYSAGASAKLLEEIDNYSTYVDVLYQYTLNLIGDKDKKSVTELVDTWNVKNEALQENTYPQFLNSYGSTANGVGTFNSAKTSVKQRIQLPLHTGIFRKSEVFANALFNGIRIEIQLRSTKDAFITPLNCRDNVLYGSDYYPKASGTIGTGAFTAGTFSLLNDKSKGIDAVNVGVSCCPFSVGQSLSVFSADGTTSGQALGGSVSSVVCDGTNISLVYAGGTGTFGTSLDTPLLRPTPTTIAGTYKISNLSMVVCEITPPSSWENQLINMASGNTGYNYDIITPTNYMDSIQSGNTAIVSQIPVVNTRIKSILSCPVPTATASFITNTQSPQYDRFVDYQYFYLNQNQPNELVPLGRYANSLPEQIHLDQVSKAIEGCEYKVQNLRNFVDCFFIGRGLSYGKGTLNLESRDLMLKVNTTANGLQNNTLFNHYVVSLRRLRVSNGDLEVFY
tara:strand:+ start:1855 stop:3471 length:1617 start_codon:yes stop_codon:yes gene_type:complete